MNYTKHFAKTLNLDSKLITGFIPKDGNHSNCNLSNMLLIVDPIKNMIPEIKSLTDFMSKEPGSCWYNPNDKDTWFMDEALRAPTTDPTQVRFLKNKVGLGSFCVGSDGLKSSDYGFYMEITTNETISMEV